MARQMEYRRVGFGVADGNIVGVVINYNDTAEFSRFRERINRGAFANSLDDVILNIQHNRERPIARSPDTLTLTDSNDALTIRADLTGTKDGEAALSMVQKGLLRGLSVEMQVIKEHWDSKSKLRTIHRAQLMGIGLVDRPAYSQSEVERAEQRFFEHMTAQHNLRKNWKPQFYA